MVEQRKLPTCEMPFARPSQWLSQGVGRKGPSQSGGCIISERGGGGGGPRPPSSNHGETVQLHNGGGARGSGGKEAEGLWLPPALPLIAVVGILTEASDRIGEARPAAAAALRSQSELVSILGGSPVVPPRMESWQYEEVLSMYALCRWTVVDGVLSARFVPKTTYQTVDYWSSFTLSMDEAFVWRTRQAACKYRRSSDHLPAGLQCVDLRRFRSRQEFTHRKPTPGQLRKERP